MKVMFINPPYLKGFSRGQRSPQVSLGGSMYYPYWLAYAAGLLENRGFEVSLIDAAAARLSRDVLYRKIREFKPDLIVLDTATASITNDLGFVFQIKNNNPGISVGLVGAHATVEAENILKENNSLDWIARREYDYTVLELTEHIKDKESFNGIEGISYRNGNQVIRNPDREYLEGLDSLPFVSKVYKKYLNIKDYYFIPSLYPMAMIITSRGCPFKCFFCVWPQVMYGHKLRQRSPESVVDEMLYIKKELPKIREIVFEDDTFALDFNRTHRICELIIKYKINLPWFANLRVDVDFQTLKLMKKAGLHSCAVGYETSSQNMLNNMEKGITIERSLKFTQETKRLGIIVHGCFMVGFPGETEETMEETLRFAKRLKCDSAQFYPIFLYPGTEAFEWAKKENYLETADYSKWLNNNGTFRAVYSLPNLPANEITDFCKKAYYHYHFNISFMFRKIWQVIFNSLERKRAFFYGLKFIYKSLKCKI